MKLLNVHLTAYARLSVHTKSVNASSARVNAV